LRFRFQPSPQPLSGICWRGGLEVEGKEHFFVLGVDALFDIEVSWSKVVKRKEIFFEKKNPFVFSLGRAV
jgi:hypothetical protein